MSYTNFSDILVNIKKNTFALPSKYNLTVEQLLKTEDINVVSNSTYTCGTGVYDYDDCKFNDDIKNFIQFGNLNDDASTGFVNIQKGSYSIACNLPQSTYRLCSPALDTTSTIVKNLKGSGFRLNLYGFYMLYDPSQYSDNQVRFVSYNNSIDSNLFNSNTTFVVEEQLINSKSYLFLKHVKTGLYCTISNNRLVLTVDANINSYIMSNIGSNYTVSTTLQIGDNTANARCVCPDPTSVSFLPANNSFVFVVSCNNLSTSYRFIQEDITDPLITTSGSIGSVNNFIISYTNNFIYNVYSGYYNNNPAFFNTATLIRSGTTNNISTLISSLSNLPLQYSVEVLGYFYSKGITDTYFFTLDNNSTLWIGDAALSGYTLTNSLNATNITYQGLSVLIDEDTYYPFRLQYGYSNAPPIYQKTSLSFTFRRSLNIDATITDGTNYFFRQQLSTTLPSSYALTAKQINTKWNRIPTQYNVSTTVSAVPTNLQVVISGNGLTAMATVRNSVILRNIDRNLNYTKVEDNKTWNKIAVSYDGNLQMIVADTFIYKSTNSINFNAIISSNTNTVLNWRSIAMSKDGKFQTAVGQNTLLYISADYGDTWINPEINIPDAQKIVNSRVRNWKDVAISSNGMIQIAVCSPSVQMWYEYVNYNLVYISYNRGFVWNAVNISGINNTNTEWDWDINNVKISDQGDFMIVTSKEYIYYSNDFGNSWKRKLYTDYKLPSAPLLRNDKLTPTNIIPFRYIFVYFPINYIGNRTYNGVPVSNNFYIKVYDEKNNIVPFKKYFTCTLENLNNFVDTDSTVGSGTNYKPPMLYSKLLIDYGTQIRVSKIEICSSMADTFKFAYFWCLSGDAFAPSTNTPIGTSAELTGDPILVSGRIDRYNTLNATAFKTSTITGIDASYLSLSPNTTNPPLNFNPFSKGVVYSNVWRTQDIINPYRYMINFYPFGLQYFEENLECDISVNGKYIVLARTNGLIYFSQDYGENYNLLNFNVLNTTNLSSFDNSSSKLWNSVSISKDGASLLVSDLQNIYYLSINNIEPDIYRITQYVPILNLNTTYNLSRISSISNLYWNSISSSSDNQTQIATTFNSNIYSSNNGGLNWTSNNSAPVAKWTCCVISKDGIYRYACAINDFVYRSVGDNNWIVVNSNLNIRSLWSSVSCSADGRYVIAVAYGRGAIYSNNFGNTFNTLNIPGSMNNWSAVSISKSGQYQILGEYNGKLYLSNDYGVTWNVVKDVNNIKTKQIKMSGDSSVVVVILYDDNPLISRDKGFTFTSLFSTYKYKGCYNDNAGFGDKKLFPYLMFFNNQFSLSDCYHYAMSVGAPIFAGSTDTCYYSYNTKVSPFSLTQDYLCKYDFKGNVINEFMSAYPFRNAVYDIQNNYLINYFSPTNGSNIQGGINARYIVLIPNTDGDGWNANYPISLSELRVYDTNNNKLDYIVYQQHTNIQTSDAKGASALRDINRETNLVQTQGLIETYQYGDTKSYIIIDLGTNQNIRIIDFFDFKSQYDFFGMKYGKINIKLIDSDQTTVKYWKFFDTNPTLNPSQFLSSFSTTYINSQNKSVTSTLHRLILNSNELRPNIFRWSVTTSTPLPTLNDYNNSLFNSVFSGWNGTNIRSLAYVSPTIPSIYRLKIKKTNPYDNKKLQINEIGVYTTSATWPPPNIALNKPVLVSTSNNSDGLVQSNNVCCFVNDNIFDKTVYTDQDNSGDTFFIIDLTGPIRTNCTNSCNLFSTYRSNQPIANPSGGYLLSNLSFIDLHTKNTDPDFSTFILEFLDANYNTIYSSGEIVPNNSYIRIQNLSSLFQRVSSTTTETSLFPLSKGLYYSGAALSQDGKNIVITVSKGLSYLSTDYGISWLPYGCNQQKVILPPGNLTSLTTSIQGLNYTSSASSNNNLSLNAFNNSNLSWRSADNTFLTDGACINPLGVWLQIQLPIAIYLQRYIISPSQTTFQTTSPSTFAVMGSNDGTNWELIDKEVNQVFFSADEVPYSISPNYNKSYSYFRLVIYTLGGLVIPTATYTEISKFSLYGITDIYNSSENVFKDWQDVCMSDDGSKIAFAVSNNNIHIGSIQSVPPTTLIPNPNRFASLNIHTSQLISAKFGINTNYEYLGCFFKSPDFVDTPSAYTYRASLIEAYNAAITQTATNPVFGLSSGFKSWILNKTGVASNTSTVRYPVQYCQYDFVGLDNYMNRIKVSPSIEGGAPGITTTAYRIKNKNNTNIVN